MKRTRGFYFKVVCGATLAIFARAIESTGMILRLAWYFGVLVFLYTPDRAFAVIDPLVMAVRLGLPVTAVLVALFTVGQVIRLTRKGDFDDI